MRPSEDWNEETARRAEETLGYVFRNKELLRQCFTHRSFANEKGGRDNERLEFLGDAVLQLAVSESLYLKDDTNEGKMTESRKRFVSRGALTEAAERARILPFLRYSGGEDTVSGKTPSNLFEAVVAGIYLDGGMKSARAFLKRFLIESGEENFKTQLQEYVQEREKRPPEYSTRETEHGFSCRVRALGEEEEGFGSSKKLAETDAAEKLLRRFKERIE